MRIPNQKIDKWKRDNYQLSHLDAALKYVTNWSTAIDCGAHVGTWTNRLAGLFGSVYAYEFSKPTYDILVENMDKHPNVVCKHAAVIDEDTNVGYRDKGKEAISLSRYIDKSGSGIQGIRLDDEDIRGKVGFLKLDIEGSEPFALQGALDLIKRDKPVILMEKKHVARFGFDKNFCEKLLLELGYTKKETIGQDEIYDI